MSAPIPVILFILGAFVATQPANKVAIEKAGVTAVEYQSANEVKYN